MTIKLFSELYEALKPLPIDGYSWRKDAFYVEERDATAEEWKILGSAVDFMDHVARACPFQLRFEYYWDKEAELLAVDLGPDELMFSRYGIAVAELARILDPAKRRAADPSLVDSITTLLLSKLEPRLRDEYVEAFDNVLVYFGAELKSIPGNLNQYRIVPVGIYIEERV